VTSWAKHKKRFKRLKNCIVLFHVTLKLFTTLRICTDIYYYYYVYVCFWGGVRFVVFAHTLSIYALNLGYCRYDNANDVYKAQQWFKILHGAVPNDSVVLSRLGALYNNDDDQTQAFHNFSDVCNTSSGCLCVCVCVCVCVSRALNKHTYSFEKTVLQLLSSEHGGDHLVSCILCKK